MTNDNLKNIREIFEFLHIIENLKSTTRFCKTKTGRQESTAEHTWRLSLMTFMIAEELKIDIDLLHAIKIALVHDLAEAITGDIDAHLIHTGKYSKELKEKNEKIAMQKIVGELPPDMKKEILNLWLEYEEAKTREALYIKALDKIETTIQLFEMGYDKYDEHEFVVTYADKHVQKFSELKPVLQVLKEKLREEYVKNNIAWKEVYEI